MSCPDLVLGRPCVNAGRGHVHVAERVEAEHDRGDEEQLERAQELGDKGLVGDGRVVLALDLDVRIALTNDLRVLVVHVAVAARVAVFMINYDH